MRQYIYLTANASNESKHQPYNFQFTPQKITSALHRSTELCYLRKRAVFMVPAQSKA
jgi:hypothetical protein